MNGPINGFPFTCNYREKVIPYTDNNGVKHCGYECSLLREHDKSNCGCDLSRCPFKEDFDEAL